VNNWTLCVRASNIRKFRIQIAIKLQKKHKIEALNGESEEEEGVTDISGCGAQLPLLLLLLLLKMFRVQWHYREDTVQRSLIMLKSAVNSVIDEYI